MGNQTYKQTSLGVCRSKEQHMAMKKKPVIEKKTGEKYSSRSAMRTHEKSESKSERKREYGSKKGK